MAAQYGVADPKELPDTQRLEIEDAYFSGAASGFYHGFGADDAEALSANAELQAFGEDIVERYRRAWLGWMLCAALDKLVKEHSADDQSDLTQ